ncbi:hypothetical protein X975_15049, partial [Stegodyphus mimosarum]
MKLAIAMACFLAATILIAEAFPEEEGGGGGAGAGGEGQAGAGAGAG